MAEPVPFDDRCVSIREWIIRIGKTYGLDINYHLDNADTENVTMTIRFHTYDKLYMERLDFSEALDRVHDFMNFLRQYDIQPWLVDSNTQTSVGLMYSTIAITIPNEKIDGLYMLSVIDK